MLGVPSVVTTGATVLVGAAAAAVGLIEPELALAEPEAFVAVTVQITVVPSSATCSVYELLVADEMLEPLRFH